MVDAAGVESVLRDNTILLCTPVELINILRKELAPIDLINSILVDDIDYIASFGQSANLYRVVSFLKTTNASQFEIIRFVITYGELQAEEITKIKTSITTQFISLKYQPEYNEEEKLQAQPDAADPLSQQLFSQFYYLNEYHNLFCLLFVINKYDLFPSPLVIVCKDMNLAYKVAAFIEKIDEHKPQVYNSRHPSALKTYRIALLNSR